MNAAQGDGRQAKRTGWDMGDKQQRVFGTGYNEETVERRDSDPEDNEANSRAVRKRLDGNHEIMRREELSTCQPDAQADYNESLCISQTVESSILTALWGGRKGKGSAGCAVTRALKQF